MKVYLFLGFEKSNSSNGSKRSLPTLSPELHYLRPYTERLHVRVRADGRCRRLQFSWEVHRGTQLSCFQIVRSY